MVKESQLYKILVVEDNLGDYVLLEEYISDSFLRLQMVHVTNYKAFVQTIELNSDFDILFLDLTLPDKYGIDLIKACTERVDSMPIIVLTGYPDFDFAKQSLSLGVSDYLLKEDLSATTLHKCIIYNIERHKSILKIKNSEQYYIDLFQLSPNPLLVFDEKTTLILDVNTAAIDNYQYDIQEFRQISLHDLQVENKLCEEMDESLGLTHKGSKLMLDKLECHKKKNGDLLYVSCTKNKVVYQGIEAMILSVENLTKEILHIQAIQLQNKKLKQIAWMQSHVVRAPVARIMGLINLLSQETNTKIDHNNIYKMVMKSSLELDTVIREIVDKTNEI